MVVAASGAAAGVGLTDVSADDDRPELGRSLQELRRAAGLNQLAVAAHSGLSQSRLSRIERGTSLPTDAETDRLARLYGADSKRRDTLLRLTKDAHAGIRDTRLVVQRGNTLALQQRWRRMEATARVLRFYHPAVVHGILQTASYAAAALRQPAGSDVVRDRMLRLERMIVDPDREYHLLQTEGALRYQVESVATMIDQIDGIAELSSRRNLRVGIIPASTPMAFTAGVGFHLYDNTAVVIGLDVASATLTDSADITHFRELFDRLADVAVFGDEARDLLSRIAGDFRRMQPERTDEPRALPADTVGLDR